MAQVVLMILMILIGGSWMCGQNFSLWWCLQRKTAIVFVFVVFVFNISKFVCCCICILCYQVAICAGVIREKQIYDPSRPSSIFTSILTCPTAYSMWTNKFKSDFLYFHLEPRYPWISSKAIWGGLKGSFWGSLLVLSPQPCISKTPCYSFPRPLKGSRNMPKEPETFQDQRSPYTHNFPWGPTTPGLQRPFITRPIKWQRQIYKDCLNSEKGSIYLILNIYWNV